MDLTHLGVTLAHLDLEHLGRDTPWFAGWGTLALVNAGLAQGKGRSGLAWFLVSLLLGPIATFLLVVFCDDLRE